MNRVFTLEEWFAFVDDTDAFDAKVSGRVSNEKVIISCSNGVDVFNKELFELALELIGLDEDWKDVYDEMVRHRSSS